MTKIFQLSNSYINLLKKRIGAFRVSYSLFMEGYSSLYTSGKGGLASSGMWGLALIALIGSISPGVSLDFFSFSLSDIYKARPKPNPIKHKAELLRKRKIIV